MRKRPPPLQRIEWRTVVLCGSIDEWSIVLKYYFRKDLQFPRRFRTGIHFLYLRAGDEGKREFEKASERSCRPAVFAFAVWSYQPLKAGICEPHCRACTTFP